MELFGLTSFGVYYIEPVKSPKHLLEVENSGDQKFFETMKELDCYIGFTDGFAYKSNDRSRMRKKYVIKCEGSFDMYNRNYKNWY